MTDEELVLSVFAGGEQLTIADIESRTKLPIARVRAVVIDLQYKTYLKRKSGRFRGQLWLQTWTVASNEQTSAPTTSTQYPTDLDPRALEPQFSCHMLALTAEGLHDKSAIAEQLAWRDKRIEALKESVQAYQRLNEEHAQAVARAKDGLEMLIAALDEKQE